MSTFELAIPVILKQEGGFVDNVNDPGGATNYGISLRFLKSLGYLSNGLLGGDLDHDGDVDISDIRDMTPDMASALIRTYWWDKYGYGRINDQLMATKILSCSVHMGSIQAHKLSQRACWSVAGYQCIKDDGILGDKSITLLNSVKPVQPLRSECAGFYRVLLTETPKFQEYINGWLKRAYY